ncbi:hypothetical protein [Natrinema ejinorense]|uniref:Uncharacterized protein n=1 Tax=Natrinema ejinorense TaxID=373386 RepID=A0A2A5QPY3_9EURY|nr:hypothetical protein [Natrinema ejinorense]PCR88859.1 hypothetical protein CP557_20475 [Natrinema ejinorense]
MVSPLWNTVFWILVGLFGLSNLVTAILGTGSGTIFGMAASPTTVILWNAFLALSCFYFAYRSLPDRGERSTE